MVITGPSKGLLGGQFRENPRRSEHLRKCTFRRIDTQNSARNWDLKEESDVGTGEWRNPRVLHAGVNPTGTLKIELVGDWRAVHWSGSSPFISREWLQALQVLSFNIFSPDVSLRGVRIR